jgi:hypothetical protein
MYRDPKEVISAMARALLEHDEDDDIRRVFCDRWRAHTKDFEVLYDVVTEDQMMIVDVRPVFGVRPVTRSALPV